MSAGCLVTGIRKEANRKQSEKAWEPVAEISGSSAVTNDTGAAVQVQEVYRDAAIEEVLPYTYTVRNFSREQRNRVVSILGTAGYISVTDCAFINTITVLPFDDGTFRYLSNSIEKRKLDIPAVYRIR